MNDLTLLDTHVLEPKWITEGVYKIITSPQLTEQQGVLYEADLPELLKKQTEDDYFYPPNKYSYLLELMKKFELSYRLNDHAVLIPQLLKPEEPEFAFDDSGQVLRFQISYDYLDDLIMPRFIVALHQDIDSRIQWRKGVLLKNQSFNSQAVVRVNYQDRLLTIVVKGEQKRDYFAVIRKALQDIHASFEWKKPPIELVPLPDNPKFTVKYTNLIGYEKAGEEKYFDGELGKYYSVSELLDGIEKQEQRRDGNIYVTGDYVREKKVSDKNININGVGEIHGDITAADENIKSVSPAKSEKAESDDKETKYFKVITENKGFILIVLIFITVVILSVGYYAVEKGLFTHKDVEKLLNKSDDKASNPKAN